LLSLNLARVGALAFEAGENPALVIAEIDYEPDEPGRAGNVLDRPNRPDPNVRASMKRF
jgi:hypothetical protein